MIMTRHLLVAAAIAVPLYSAALYSAAALANDPAPGPAPAPAETPCKDYFPDLPALAKRLNVEPVKDDTQSIQLRMCSGERYDVFVLINKVLDRMDAQVPPPRRHVEPTPAVPAAPEVVKGK